MTPEESIIGMLNAADHLRAAEQTLVRIPGAPECPEMKEFYELLAVKAEWLATLGRDAIHDNFVESQESQLPSLVERRLAD